MGPRATGAPVAARQLRMPRQIIKLKRPHVDFDATGIDPHAWRTVAQQLLDGAKLLWNPIAEGIQGYARTRGGRTADEQTAFEKQVAYYRPFFTIAGFAIENELKALIIHREAVAGHPPQTAKDALKLFQNGKRTRQHDLVALAARAGLHQLAAGEQTMLERLTQFVRWAGRYPIPLTAPETNFARTTRECDLEDLVRFMEKLEREFR